MKQSNFNLIAMLVLLLIIAIPVAIYQHSTVDYVDVKIKSKERITTGSGESISSKYIVFTDSEVFQNSDTLYHLKYNSSDLQGYLDSGMSCRFKVYGWRIKFLSWYRNIIEAECKGA